MPRVFFFTLDLLEKLLEMFQLNNPKTREKKSFSLIGCCRIFQTLLSVNPNQAYFCVSFIQTQTVFKVQNMYKNKDWCPADVCRLGVLTPQGVFNLIFCTQTREIFVSYLKTQIQSKQYDYVHDCGKIIHSVCIF